MILSLSLAMGFAAQADARDVAHAPITVDVLQGWVMPDGSRMAALRMVLEPGWKTYWRAPGDAGIPPQFDWRRSGNLNGVAITWPTPKVFDQGGMQAIGYSNQVILPLRMVPQQKGKPVAVDVMLDIGVCSDICVPEQLRVKALLDTQETKPQPAILAAMTEVPLSRAEAGVRSATCHLRPSEKGLEITATLNMPDTGGRETVVIEPGRDGIWVSATDSARSGSQLTAQADMIASNPALLALDRSAIRITVLGQNQAVDIQGCTAQ